MESIALHDIDEQLSALLKKRAAQAQKSIDQFILDTLKKHFGLEQKKEYDDLDHLFGSWSEEEFNSVQKKISSERKIDQELWQ
ncbi:MAG: antitoxin [Candidatus Electrothrix sp. ATG2]|nr:antitoxin [Candidatus Electrothrix sp. ATG2]